MDERERQLDYLAKHASNAPSQPSRAPGSSQPLVRAVIQGIGPTLKQEFDTLRAKIAALEAENITLRTANATLEGRLSGEIAVLKAEMLAVMEGADPASPRYSATASARPRRLS